VAGFAPPLLLFNLYPFANWNLLSMQKKATLGFLLCFWFFEIKQCTPG